MFEFEFFEPDDDIGVVKATVHKTGKVGFSSGAAKKLNLEKNRYFKIGKKKGDEEVGSLYMVLTNANDKSAYKISKAGDYYYLRIKSIIDDLGYDYVNESVIFDIKALEENEIIYYRLTRRK